MAKSVHKANSNQLTNTGLVGSAGEHFVLYKLHRQGMLAAPTPRGFKAVDIIVLNPDRSVAASLQVKTRARRGAVGWVMADKNEHLEDSSLFYCLVDMMPALPVTYVVPSHVVAEVLQRSHRAWLAIPGKRGQVHMDSAVRRVQAAYGFPVPGFAAGWMKQYRENWDLLRATTARHAPKPVVALAHGQKQSK